MFTFTRLLITHTWSQSLHRTLSLNNHCKYKLSVFLPVVMLYCPVAFLVLIIVVVSWLLPFYVVCPSLDLLTMSFWLWVYLHLHPHLPSWCQDATLSPHVYTLLPVLCGMPPQLMDYISRAAGRSRDTAGWPHGTVGRSRDTAGAAESNQRWWWTWIFIVRMSGSFSLRTAFWTFVFPCLL